jgi:hypothetical protein
MNYLLYLILLYPNYDTCRSKFLNELLRVPVQKEHLMVIKANSNSKKIDIFLTNVELISNLKRKGIKLNKTIVNKIQNNQSIFAIDQSIELLGSIKYFKEVSVLQAKGKECFIDFYFDKGGYLKSTIKGEYVGQIIKALFDWNVFVSEDDLGVLHLVRKGVCN